MTPRLPWRLPGRSGPSGPCRASWRLHPSRCGHGALPPCRRVSDQPNRPADMTGRAASARQAGRRAAARRGAEAGAKAAAPVAEAEPQVRMPSRTRRRTSDRPNPAVCRRWRRTRIPSSSRVSLSFHLSRNCGGIGLLGGSLPVRSDVVVPNPVILAPPQSTWNGDVVALGRSPVRQGARLADLRRTPRPRSPGPARRRRSGGPSERPSRRRSVVGPGRRRTRRRSGGFPPRMASRRESRVRSV